GAGFGIRAPGAGRARYADARAHHAGDRASPVYDRASQSHRGTRAWAGCRDGHAFGIACEGGRIRQAVPNSIRYRKNKNMTPLRIVHTESSLGWGGQEMRILSEAQGLMRRGHDVTLLCAPQARIRAEAVNWGVPAVSLPIDKKRPRCVRALAAWLRANRCDVVNTHSSTDSWLAALALLILGRPVPVVRTRHISAPVPRGPLSRWLYMSAAARVVTTGEALKRKLVEDNGFSASRIESVPTGIDAGRFRPGDRKASRARFGLPQGRTLVGIVATLRSWKGHAFLIDAMAQLPED